MNKMCNRCAAGGECFCKCKPAWISDNETGCMCLKCQDAYFDKPIKGHWKYWMGNEGERREWVYE